MSSNHVFRVVEHLIPCQHIREYPAATANSQEDILQLVVKQYVPTDNVSPRSGDVSIIFAPGTGFPKELYEPLWEELHARSNEHGFRIRSIWSADFAHQGQSYLINQNNLGNDPSPFDHGRDLLHLINIKRAEMPRPIIGIGHSIGGVALVHLGLVHPRLFYSLTLLEPVIMPAVTPLENGTMYDHKALLETPLRAGSYRRDMWPSRRAAADYFRHNHFYRSWDPRVFERQVKYGLRDIPTFRSRYSDPGNGTPVTLATPRSLELVSFARPFYNLTVPDAGPHHPRNRFMHPDLDPKLMTSLPFYRPEPSQAFRQLQYLRPSVLYIFGNQSPFSRPELRAEKLNVTGIDVGGNGGLATGRVKELCVQGCSHQVPFEAVDECADAIVHWLGSELNHWRREEKAFAVAWGSKSPTEKTRMDGYWRKHLARTPRDKSNL